MRRGLGRALRIGVGNTAVALALTSRWGAARLLDEAAYDAAMPSALPEAIARLLGSRFARWPVSFVLSNDLVRFLSVTPPRGASKRSDLHAAAALRFSELYGESSANWTTSANWNVDNTFIAAAIRRATLDMIEQACVPQRLTITGIEPHFVVAWNASCNSVPEGAWFALVHASMLMLGVPRGAELVAIRATQIPELSEVEWLEGYVRREALLLGQEVPRAIALSGDIPASWLRAGTNLTCHLVRPLVPDGLSAAAQLSLAGIVR